jgi:hypothetical protein
VWSQKGKGLFRKKMERLWEGKGEDWRDGWEGVREDIKGILRERLGQEGEKKERDGGMRNAGREGGESREDGGGTGGEKDTEK